MPDNHDPVTLTLSALRTDVERTPLADSRSVRRRGDRRTRNQAVGGALAVVALVAGVIGVSGSFSGNDLAEQVPAETPSVSISQSPNPTTGTRLVLDSSVLLGPGDMPPAPNQDFILGKTLDPATSTDAAERFVTVCGAGPTGATTPRDALMRTFYSELDASGWQWVAEYATADEAGQLWTDLMTGCTADGADVAELTTTATQPGVPAAFRASRFSAVPNSEYNGEVVGIARIDNVVVVIGLRAMAREGDIDLAAFEAAVVRASERLSSRS